MARASSKKSARSPYGVHPSVGMVIKWVESLPARTGRTFAQWTKIVRDKGPADDRGRKEWLRKEHGFGGNEAGWIVERAAGRTGTWPESDAMYLQAAEGYVEAMFAGAKSGLRPIYDALLTMGLSLGDDVKACPCQTMIPLYRAHVFANLKPTTRTRLDLGLCLPGAKAKGRLIDTGGAAKGDRITHRIGISALDEIDDEVHRRLKDAYAAGDKPMKRSK